MRCWRARSIAVRYPSSAASKSAGPSALIAAMTSASVGGRVDLAGGRGPRGALFRELLPAEREDVVRVEPVERPMRHESVVAFTPDGPVVGPIDHRVVEPATVQLDGHLGGRDRPLESLLVGWAEDAGPGGDDLVEEERQLVRRPSLHRLPDADLRDRGAGLGRLEVPRHILETAGHRLQALGQGRVVAREQQEQTVADPVERERAALPQPQRLGVEHGALQVVDLELALEAGAG